MIWIGTSGWQYDDWPGRFYPKNLPKARWLEYYSREFPTVEVNNTFYRLPGEEAFVRWREQSAPGFVVTVKASRFITHLKRLKDPNEPLELLWSRCRGLGDKLGPVLVQLPPRFKVDMGRLETFLQAIPAGMRTAFEFRDPTWHTQEVFERLDGAGAAYVWADSAGRHNEPVLTGGWAYVRFHKGGPIRPGYSRTALRRWAKLLASTGASDTFVYFNNDTGGAAIRDARTLADLLESRAS